MAISLEPWPKILDIRGCAWGKPVGRGRAGNRWFRDANFMLTITITITIPYHYGIKPLPQPWPWPRAMAGYFGPGPWPRHKQISKGQGTSKSPKAKAKANGHKLVAMAQDIRYPGVRVGEACGPQMGL